MHFMIYKTFYIETTPQHTWTKLMPKEWKAEAAQVTGLQLQVARETWIFSPNGKF